MASAVVEALRLLGLTAGRSARAQNEDQLQLVDADALVGRAANGEAALAPGGASLARGVVDPLPLLFESVRLHALFHAHVRARGRQCYAAQ